MGKLNAIDWLALILVIVGGLNWGLVGVLNFDLVAWLLGAGSAFTKIIYTVVGLAAIYILIMSVKLSKK